MHLSFQSGSGPLLEPNIPWRDLRPGPVFARDIAKSFLRSAVPADDAPGITDLVNQIEYRVQDSGNETIVLRREQPRPELPDEPTADYRTYLGQESAFERVFPNSTLQLQNLTIDGVSSLSISLRLNPGHHAHESGRR
jgi:hypothetical protein